MARIHQNLDIIKPAHPSLNPLYQFSIDPDVNCIFVKHTNQLTVSIIFSRYEEIWMDPKAKPGMNFYIDYTASTNKLSAEEIRMLANYLNSKQKLLGNCKQTILCNSFIDHGYSRMLDSLYAANHHENTSKITTMIYNIGEYTDPSLPTQEAKEWLGMDLNYVIPL